MYRQRLYFFIFICFVAVSVCFSRLTYMQVIGKDAAREEIRLSRIKEAIQLPTVRGGIYDFCGRELAIDKPQFYVQVSYQMTRFLDRKFWKAIIYDNVSEKMGVADAKEYVHDKYAEEYAAINNNIAKCSKLLGVDEQLLRDKIAEINDGIWELREYIAWKKTFPESELYLEYKARKKEVPYSKAMKNFDKCLMEADPEPSPKKRKSNAEVRRYKLALERDLLESKQMHPIFKIGEYSKELLRIQEEFAGMEGVEIAPMTQRVYHEHSESACQIIGWVGAANATDNQLFPKDIYSIYSADDFAGKGGIEWECEVLLHGKRGEVTYNRDDELLSMKPRQFGEDIHISIDIELQHRIATYLSSIKEFPEMGAVVIDVVTGEIRAMVSVPTYDLREMRKTKVYKAVLTAKTRPFESKALYQTYPPGSIIKPFILAMGLQASKVRANEPISCPGGYPPKGWPDCIIHRDFGGSHDRRWSNEGGNIGRNAIRGSCNIYFSRLADRFESEDIQRWLYSFGFGHRILTPPNYPTLLKELKRTEVADRRLSEANGVISSTVPSRVRNIHDLPVLRGYEKRLFGIGQGNMRVTVLQVANAMAALARGAVYKAPRLYIGDDESKKYRPDPLGISIATMRIVRDAMSAVVYEKGGTGNNAFKKDNYKEKFSKRKIKVFGKTGSTETPYNAWFAGFAEDTAGRSLAFAIIVKKGQSGSNDAAPKGYKILEICSDLNYIGVAPKEEAENVASDN